MHEHCLVGVLFGLALSHVNQYSILGLGTHTATMLIGIWSAYGASGSKPI